MRRLQRGEKLRMPHSRPMPALGPRCGELRITDASATWRVLYRLDPDAVIILEVFTKKTEATPKTVLETCAARLRQYDQISRSER